MNILRKFVDLVLYSNVWIGLCAVAQIQHTYLLLGIDRGPDIYSVFLFAATLALYCLHRVIGIERITEFSVSGRFRIITKYKRHIVVYGILGLLASTVSFLFLPVKAWALIAIPALISIAYVTPLGRSRRRLRDYPVIKIFLIALNWSLLTALVPAILYGSLSVKWALPVLLERMLFTFALTIPFDIRDYTVDKPSGIKTIPQLTGILRSKLIGALSIGSSTAIAFALIGSGVYPEFYRIPVILYGVMAVLVLWGAHEERSDYYFAGLVDGVMLLGWAMVYVAAMYV